MSDTPEFNHVLSTTNLKPYPGMIKVVFTNNPYRFKRQIVPQLVGVGKYTFLYPENTLSPYDLLSPNLFLGCEDGVVLVTNSTLLLKYFRVYGPHNPCCVTFYSVLWDKNCPPDGYIPPRISSSARLDDLYVEMLDTERELNQRLEAARLREQLSTLYRDDSPKPIRVRAKKVQKKAKKGKK